MAGAARHLEARCVAFDAVTGVEIAVSLVGGVVGALLVRAVEAVLTRRRENRDLLAALRLLRDEIRHNIGVLHELGVLKANPRSVQPLARARYDEVAALLARLCPPAIRLEIARLYALLDRDDMARTLMTDLSDELRNSFITTWAHQKDCWVDLDRALRLLVMKIAGEHEPEVGPVELGGWQPVDPATGLTPSDLHGQRRKSVTRRKQEPPNS